MVTFEEVLQRAATLGLPIAHNEFVVTKATPAPDLPFLCWLSEESQRGSDDRNRIREISGSIELYTDRKPDEAIEKKIESLVLYDVAFTKNQVLIQNENMVQTAYDFQIVQKL